MKGHDLSKLEVNLSLSVRRCRLLGTDVVKNLIGVIRVREAPQLNNDIHHHRKRKLWWMLDSVTVVYICAYVRKR